MHSTLLQPTCSASLHKWLFSTNQWAFAHSSRRFKSLFRQAQLATKTRLSWLSTYPIRLRTMRNPASRHRSGFSRSSSLATHSMFWLKLLQDETEEEISRFLAKLTRV